MPLDIIVGTQWGDEGKGRVVDLFSARADIVARWNGGDNAGHTVTVGLDTFKLHLIPSGIVYPHTIAVIGNGMVVNPPSLLSEMEMVRGHGIEVNPDRLRLSSAAHIVTPAHRALDKAQETSRGSASLGTTGRGIGPAYTDKAARTGIRLGEMTDLDAFRMRILAHVKSANQILEGVYAAEPLDPARVADEFALYAEALRPYITDTSALLWSALQKGQSVLAEGAQATLLDIDMGTYPYVTSSTPTAPGALPGLGIGFGHLGRVIGVTKSFQTRVGTGPFPTEISGESAVRLRGTGSNPWDEFGTTTGRPRRVGWLDGVLLRYAVRVNGLTELVVTKMDVLSGLPFLNICTAYRANGQEYLDLPELPANLGRYTPVYERLEGWEEDIREVRAWENLPAEARRYLECVADLSGVPVGQISVGPEREQVIDL